MERLWIRRPMQPESGAARPPRTLVVPPGSIVDDYFANESADSTIAVMDNDDYPSSP